MSYFLWKARLASRAQRTINLLSRLIMLSIETGLVTTLTGITGLVLVRVFENTALYVVPVFILGKLYSNSLLVVCFYSSYGAILEQLVQVLNSRLRIVDGRQTAEVATMNDLIVAHDGTSRPHATPVISIECSRVQSGIPVELSPSWKPPESWGISMGTEGPKLLSADPHLTV